MKPRQVLLFYSLCLALLGALSCILPSTLSVGSLDLRTPDIAEVLDLSPAPALPDSMAAGSFCADSLSQEATSDTLTWTLALPSLQADSVHADSVDTRIYLDAFYAALQHADQEQVRILHYGDSQLEEDRMTSQLRDTLQNRFGGCGAGLLPLLQTIPSRSVRQRLYINGALQNTQSPLPRNLVYGPSEYRRKDHLYGPMGQVAVLDNRRMAASEKAMLVVSPTTPHAQGDTIRVFCDTTIAASVSGDTVRLRGRGNVYGVSMESPAGILVDNIGMRGCSGLIFTQLDSAQLTDFYRDNNVRLIIMQFGGNAIPGGSETRVRNFTEQMRRQVQYVRRCAPRSSILLIGPSDMSTHSKGACITYPMVPVMDRMFRQMAVEERIGYYSLFQAMGGAGSMQTWRRNGLAGSDGIHFTPKGANRAGRELGEWLLEPLPSPAPVLPDTSSITTNLSNIY